MTDQKQSQFIEIEELSSSDYVPVFGNGSNRKINKNNLFEQIKDETQIFIYPTTEQLQAADLVADVTWPVYVRNAETQYRLYEITSLAAGVDDISLNNGLTATFQEEYSGSGFVVGPAVSTDGALAVFDGVGGTQLKNGPVPTTIGSAFLTTPNSANSGYPKKNTDNTLAMQTANQLKVDLSIDQIDNTGFSNKVTGPASVFDGVIALFDGVTGKLVKAGDTIANYLAAFLVTLYNIFPKTIANYPALSATGATIGQLVNITCRTSGTIGGGPFIAVSSVGLTPDGGTISASATVGVLWQRINYSALTPAMFGCLESSSDCTTLYQAFLNVGIASGGTIDISGNYKVLSVNLNNTNGLRITGRGSLVGVATSTTEALLSAKNVINIECDGQWFINCNYNTFYNNAVWLYTDAVSQAVAYLNLYNVSPQNAKRAWKIGNDNRPDDLVSEINIFGGQTYGCPSVLEAVGAQTVVNLTGCTLASLVGIPPAGAPATAWALLPQKTIVARGATVNITGGELLHVLLSTGGTGSAFNTLCETQACDTLLSGKIYGVINVTGAIVESATRIGSTSNPAGLASPTDGLIKFTGCHGVHTQDVVPMIETDATFLGKLQIKNNNFFSTVARTQQNIVCSNACEVDCDATSFGKNYKPFLSGITGGIVKFPYRMILNTNNLNGQSIPTGTTATLNFTAVLNTGNLARFTSGYSAGVFTVPNGGLKNVRIDTQVLKTGLAGEWYVQVNSVSYGVRTLGQYNTNSYSIDTLNAGDTIKVVTLNSGGVLSANSAVTDWFQIFASND